MDETFNKHAQISQITNKLLDGSIPHMRQLIEKALNSSGLDIEGWSKDDAPMILPKSILIAVLETEAFQYKATGTSYQKEVNKNVKNLKYFL